MHLQASVHSGAPDGSGEVILDDGLVRPFDSSVLADSGLRHLRVGQRVSVQVTDDRVTRLWIVGIGSTETIG